MGETLTAIAAAAEFAQGRRGPVARVEVFERRPPPAGAAAFETPRGGTLLQFSEHVFAPEAYASWAAERIGARGSEPDTSDPGLPLRLADLRLESLHRDSMDVSKALTEHPRSPGAHADAALVLAALAFREAAAGHTDPRHEMTRITAHLAMSQALRGSAPEPASARLAHLTLLMLAGRMADVVARLDGLPPTTDPGEITWRRSLRMRATGDWRVYTWKESATLLEKLSWARAYRRGIDSDRWYALLGELPQEQQMLPDWGRMTLQGSLSVRDCHAYASSQAAVYDIGEAMRAAELFRGEPVDIQGLGAALNDEAAPGGFLVKVSVAHLEVLDWGRLAGFIQRHLAARLSYEIYCNDDVFALRAETPAVVARQEAMFGRMRLFPLEAQRAARTPTDYERFARPAAELVRQRPELITPHLWNLLYTVPAFAATPPLVPAPAEWFDPASPAGTAFENGHGEPRPAGTHSVAGLAEYVRLNPYNASFRWAEVTARLGQQPSYAALLQAYGPVAEWDLRAMRQLASSASKGSDDHKRWLEKRCSVDVDTCAGLGWLLREGGQEAAAADVYFRYWKEAADRVAVANTVRWLVEYLETHRRPTDALEVARDAAETYSQGGLTTLAWLYEKRGRWHDAEELYRQSDERYDNPNDVYEFYTRGIAAGQTRHAKARDELVAAAFPGGKQRVTGNPSGPPTSGVQIGSLEPKARAAGLASGDVIVAVDGIRVENFRQFAIVRMAGTDPNMRFLIYRGGEYREVLATFNERRIPAWFGDFPSRR